MRRASIVAVTVLALAACTSNPPAGSLAPGSIAASPRSSAQPAPSAPAASVAPAPSTPAQSAAPAVTPAPAVTLGPPKTPDPTPRASLASVEPLQNVIAYVRGQTNDEIRLIDPDGTDDRALWAHGIDDPNEVYEVWSLMWSPDSRRLAFASTHENWCSINDSDVFVVAADGTQYRRVTQAPACADLAAFPQGEVRVPVSFNPILGGSFFGFVYLQGAPEIKLVSLSDGGSSEIVFEQVADFGDGFLQIPSVIDGSGRDYGLGSVVDVVAGSSVTAPSLGLFDPAVNWEPRSPTWRADGSMLAYAYGFNSLFEIDADPTPVDYGVSLLAAGTRAAADVALHLAWGPTDETADQLLYQGSLFDGSEGVWLTTRGAATEAAPLLTHDVFSSINGIAWLPDGSGFVYTMTKGDLLSTESACVIGQHGLKAGTARTVVELDAEYCGLISVSGDGERLVFERAGEVDVTGTELIDPDLWTVSLDGSNLELLVEDARAPAWSW